MQRNRPLIVSWAAILVSLTLITAGWVGAVNAARPTPGVAHGQPLITDPYHHLSGVVAVPKERMMGSSPGLLERWAGRLTPPVFGPNIDASLNNGSAQNETTMPSTPKTTSG